jgi:hypothetical protein
MQKTPPRFVPTLTQVIPPEERKAVSAVASVASANTPEIAPASVEQVSKQLRQQLLVRTRQYIDIELQRRIRETVSQLALEHAHKLYEELQPELESTVRQVVEEAVAQAIAHASTHSGTNAP